MIILRQRSFSKPDYNEYWQEYKDWEKQENKRQKKQEKEKKKLEESRTPIYDKYLYTNLSKGQAKSTREEDNDRRKLYLQPYIDEIEKRRGVKMGRPTDYEDEEKTISEFKKSNQKKNRILGGLTGGSLGFLGGITAGTIKTKNPDKAILAGLAGAGIGSLAGAGISKSILGKKDEKLIKEALEERRNESRAKFGKRSKV